MWLILHNLDSCCKHEKYVANSKSKIIKPIPYKLYSFLALIILCFIHKWSLVWYFPVNSCYGWWTPGFYTALPSLFSSSLPPTGRRKHRVLCARSLLLPIINYLLVPNNFASQFLSHLTHRQAPDAALYLLSSGDLLRNSFENTQILRMQFGSEGKASLLRLAQCVFISLP